MPVIKVTSQGNLQKVRETTENIVLGPIHSILTNESHSILCDSNGKEKTGEIGINGLAITKALGFVNNQPFTYTSSDSPTNTNFAISSITLAMGTGWIASENTSTGEIYVSTVGTSDSAMFEITIKFPNNQTIKKVWSLDKIKNSALVNLSGSNQIIKYDKNEVIYSESNVNITLTANPRNIVQGYYKWFRKYDGGTWSSSLQSSTSPTFIIDKATFTGFIAESTYKVELYENSNQTTKIDEDTFTIVKLFDGADGSNGTNGIDGINGIDSTIYWLVVDTEVILKNSNDINFTPSTINITNKRQTGINPVDNYLGWLKIYTSDGTTETLRYTSSLAESAKSYSIIDCRYVKIRLYDNNTFDNLLDEEIIPVNREGSYLISLSNDNHTVPSDYDGSNPDFTGASTNVKVFKGSSDVTAQWSISPSLSGVSGNWSSNTYTVNSMPDNTGYIDFTATKVGETSLVARFSLSKARKGNNGSEGVNARVVNLTTTVQGFVYTTNGTSPSPTTAIITAIALNTTGTVYYEFFIDDISIQNTTSNTLNYTAKSTLSAMPDKVEVQIREGNNSNPILARDQITLVGVKFGSNAITTLLSNEAHTFPSSQSGVVSSYANSGTEIIAWQGGTQLLVDQNSPYGNNTFRITNAVGTNITVGTPSGIDGATTIIYNDHSNMTNDTAKITYTIVAKDENGIETTLTKVQTFTKSKAGTDSQTLILTSDFQSFNYDKDGSPSPLSQTITFNALLQNLTGTVTFTATKYNVLGTSLGTVTLGGSGNTSRTLTNVQFDVAAYLKVVATLGSLSDTITIVRLKDGSDALIGYLTNESVTLPASATGVVSSFSSANGYYKVYKGLSEVTSSCTFSEVSETNCTGTIDNSSNKGYYAVSALSQDLGVYKIRATYNGVNLDKDFTLSKSKAGIDGSNAITGLLSNENITIPTLYDGTGYSLLGVGGTFQMFSGTTNVTTSSSAAIVGGTDNGTYYTKTQNGLTLTLTKATGVYTLGGSWTSDSETFSMTSLYSGVTVTKTFSISKAKAGSNGTNGSNGTDAMYVKTTSESQVYKYLKGQTTPISTTIILSTQTFGITFSSAQWQYKQPGGNWNNINGQTTLNYTDSHTATHWSGFTAVSFRCLVNGTYSDPITISKLYDGNDGATGLPGDPGIQGPGTPYRGLFDGSGGTIYYNNTLRRDIVKYSNVYYIYKGTNGLAKYGWNSADWESFGGTYSSIATGLILAENATIIYTLIMGDNANWGTIRSYAASGWTSGDGYWIEGGQSGYPNKARIRVSTMSGSTFYTGWTWDGNKLNIYKDGNITFDSDAGYSDSKNIGRMIPITQSVYDGQTFPILAIKRWNGSALVNLDGTATDLIYVDIGTTSVTNPFLNNDVCIFFGSTSNVLCGVATPQRPFLSAYRTGYGAQYVAVKLASYIYTAPARLGYITKKTISMCTNAEWTSVASGDFVFLPFETRIQALFKGWAWSTSRTGAYETNNASGFDTTGTAKCRLLLIRDGNPSQTSQIGIIDYGTSYGSAEVSVGSGVVTCFDIETTQITMGDNTKKLLKDVEIGDEVLVYNTQSQEFISKLVLNYKESIADEVFILEDGSIVTPRHRFLTRQGYIEIKDICIEEEVFTKDGWKVLGDKIRSYDNYVVRTLTIDTQDDNERSFIANDYIVHNAKWLDSVYSVTKVGVCSIVSSNWNDDNIDANGNPDTVKNARQDPSGIYKWVFQIYSASGTDIFISALNITTGRNAFIQSTTKIGGLTNN